MPLLTTPAIYKNWQQGTGLFPLGISDSSLDAFLSIVCPEVDAAIRNELNRFVIEQTTPIVEFPNGTGTPSLYLRCIPVQAIIEVRVQPTSFPGGDWGQAPNSFDSTTILQPGCYAIAIDDPINQWSRIGRLVRTNGGVWPGIFYTPYNRLSMQQAPGDGNIMVTYTAGLTNNPSTVPFDLQLAANLMISQIRVSRLYGYVPTSEGLAEYHYSLGKVIAQILQAGTVAAILAKYKVLPI